MSTTAQRINTPTADEFVERFFASALATAELMSAYLGDRLGWYADLAAHPASSAEDLARRTGCNARYAREWLEMQAAYGIVEADTSAKPATFTLPPGPAEVLLDHNSLAFLGALPRMSAASFHHLPELLNAYRNGGGVSWERLGADARESQAALNRPWFETRLAPALAGVPDLDFQLTRPGARVLDVGCGGGWSTIALARAYPQATFVGLDRDEESIVMANASAAALGLDDRISFVTADGAASEAHGSFDVAFAFECLHDMSHPVPVLAAVRDSLVKGGRLIVMDEAVSDEFTGPANEVDRFMYAASLFVCLPDGMASETPSAGTGTVLRPSTLAGYATQAGYHEPRVLPIEDFSFFRFYELTPC